MKKPTMNQMHTALAEEGRKGLPSANLAERIEAGEASTAEVMVALRYKAAGFIADRVLKVEPLNGEPYDEALTDCGDEMLTPLFLYSLDAALSLLEQVLPGWDYTISNIRNNSYITIFPDFYNVNHRQFGKSKTPAAALVAAIVRAKESE